MKMKRIPAIAFITLGTINALVFWVMIVTYINFDWAPDPLKAFAHIATTIVFMRAPFSKKNIDHYTVTYLRVLLAGLLVIGGVGDIGWLRDGSVGIGATIAFFSFLLLTIYYLLTMKLYRQAGSKHHPSG